MKKHYNKEISYCEAGIDELAKKMQLDLQIRPANEYR